MWVAPLLAALAAGLVLAPAVPAPDGRLAVGHAARQPGGAAPAPPIPESLQRMADVLGTGDGPIPERFATWPQDLRLARARAAHALGGLLGLSRGWPPTTPAPYRRQLATMADAVEEAAGDPTNTRFGLIIEPLADDLDTKLAHCVANGGRLGGLVTVRVRTVRGRREQRDWQVMTLPRIFDGAPSAVARPFPELSSPTSEQLVPGRYLLWARDPVHGRVSDRLVVVVGGRPSLTVDLPVPAPVP